MANSYCNLTGANKIKDEYTKINDGFDAVETDMNNRAKLNAENTFTQRQIFEGISIFQRYSRPQHIMVSPDSNNGIRTEYHEGLERLAWQSTNVNGGFVANLMYLDRSTGELYITPSGHQAWHAGNLPYEEGSFTPEIYGTTTAGSNTYATQSGSYIRIGKLVYTSGILTLSSKDTNMAGGARIRGLPFPVGGTVASVTLGRVDNVTMPAGAIQIVPYFVSGEIMLRYMVSGAAGSEIMASHLANNSRVQFTAVYQTT